MYRAAGTRGLSSLTRGLRRSRYPSLRSIHNDGSNSIHALSVPTCLGITHPGIDMTGAAGYEVEADDEVASVKRKNAGDSLSPRARAFSNIRLAQFASRQGHLTVEDLRGAEGYLWMGRNMGSAWSGDVWEDIWEENQGDVAGGRDEDGADANVEDVVAKRRYSGGQVTRMRKLREAQKRKQENSKTKRGPKRKKKNSLQEND